MGTRDVLLIHGTWANGGYWEDFGAELAAQGYTVHAPTLPHHGKASEMDVRVSAREVAKLGLPENVAFLRRLVEQMETPPIIVGHSLGCLYAQLLAVEVDTPGMVLIGSAPAAGIFAEYPTTVALWLRYLPRWLAGAPMPPVSRKAWNRYICNTVPRRSPTRGTKTSARSRARSIARWPCGSSTPVAAPGSTSPRSTHPSSSSRERRTGAARLR